MTTSELIPVILTGVLVLITGFYAWRTFVISRSAGRQADASTKMAQEMREQRYSECLPLLVPENIPLIERAKSPEDAYSGLQTAGGVDVDWINAGRGVAINLQFSFWAIPLDSTPGKVLFFPPREVKALAAGGRHRTLFNKSWGGQWFDEPDGYRPRLVAEYQDIYERPITTVQEFRIDKDNKQAWLGELYFTVNGRRLGQEVAGRD